MSSSSKHNIARKLLHITALLLGFVVSVIANFFKTVFKEIVTSQKILSKEPGQKVKAEPLQAEKSCAVPSEASAPACPVEPDFAVSHLQIHNGVIRDAKTKVIQLSLFAGTNPRIERMLRVPCEKLYFQRINWRFERIRLSHFTPEIARNCALPFNFDGAKHFSLADFDSKPRTIERATATHSELPFKPKPAAAETVTDSHEQPDSNGAAPAGNVTQAEGTVLTASSVVVAPEGKTSYKSFAVVLATATGEVTFQGVDLEDQFKKYHFTIGDLVSIKKSSSKFEFTKPNKKTEMRSKNVFHITVLKKAVS